MTETGSKPAGKIEPGPRNQEAMASAAQVHVARPVRVSIRWERQDDGIMRASSPHTDDAGHVLQLMAAFGTTSSSFLMQQLTHLEHATRGRGDEMGASATAVNSGIALVEAIGAENELEAALAVQMAGCHALTMEMLGRAKTCEDASRIELYSNLAVKLQRTFTAQIEALGRMRGKGQQTVRVEHVTVQSGAQAIVGDIHQYGPRGAGDRTRTEDQAHGTDQPTASASLPSPDPLRNGMPLPGDAKRKVPATRRPRDRRAKG